MVTFIIGLAILFVGAALYSKLCEHVFGPDDRQTPAYYKGDGVDYVPMRGWKNSLINLLNIAGTGPILGPIQGILFGPIAFITIPIGNVIGGAMHDYFCGMICLRDGGAQMPDTIKKYSNKGIYAVYNVFLCLLLLLVGAVFVYTPGDIAATQVFGFSGLATDWTTWVIYGVIFLYYLVATVFPIDAIIGRIYPIFGAILLFSAVGVFVGIFAHQYPLIEVWDESWANDFFDYGAYFGGVFGNGGNGADRGRYRGLHCCRRSLPARVLRDGRLRHPVRLPLHPDCHHLPYHEERASGLLHLLLDDDPRGLHRHGLGRRRHGRLQPRHAPGCCRQATAAIGVICKDILGNVGGIIAILGVIVLPITSGDTALRSLRMSLADTFHLEQKSNSKRMMLAVPVFILVAAIIVWAKFNSDGFNILWRYFAWSNQTLSLFAFLAITVWMFENGKSKWVWIPLIPGAFYSFICSSFIANATIGFHLPWNIAYIIGVVFMVCYVGGLLFYGSKRAKKVLG